MMFIILTIYVQISALNTFIVLYNHHQNLYLKPFYIPYEKLYPLKNNMSFSCKGPVTSLLFSVSINLHVLGTTYKWNHALFVTCLVYFNKRFSGSFML